MQVATTTEEDMIPATVSRQTSINRTIRNIQTDLQKIMRKNVAVNMTAGGVKKWNGVELKSNSGKLNRSVHKSTLPSYPDIY